MENSHTGNDDHEHFAQQEIQQSENVIDSKCTKNTSCKKKSSCDDTTRKCVKSKKVWIRQIQSQADNVTHALSVLKTMEEERKATRRRRRGRRRLAAEKRINGEEKEEGYSRYDDDTDDDDDNKEYDDDDEYDDEYDEDDGPYLEALKVCSRCKRADIALQIYRQQRPFSEACRIMTISVLGSCRQQHLVLDLLPCNDTILTTTSTTQQSTRHRGRHSNHPSPKPAVAVARPSAIAASYNAALAAFGKAKDWKLALHVFEHQMPREYISALTVNVVLDLLSQCRQGKEALRIFKTMVATAVTATASATTKNKKEQQPSNDDDEQPVGTAKSTVIVLPDRLTYQHLVSALVRSDMLDEASVIVKDMLHSNDTLRAKEGHKLKATEKMYEMIIAGYSRHSNWEAIQRLEQMMQRNNYNNGTAAAASTGGTRTNNNTDNKDDNQNQKGNTKNRNSTSIATPVEATTTAISTDDDKDDDGGDGDDGSVAMQKIQEIKNHYSFQHWEGLKKIGRGKEAYWELATYRPTNMTIGLHPHRNPVKNGMQLEFYENIVREEEEDHQDDDRGGGEDGDGTVNNDTDSSTAAALRKEKETSKQRRERRQGYRRKLGYLLMINDYTKNESSFLGMYLGGDSRGQGLSKACMAIWLWLCRKAGITPTTGVINKPLLSLLLEHQFGFVPMPLNHDHHHHHQLQQDHLTGFKKDQQVAESNISSSGISGIPCEICRYSVPHSLLEVNNYAQGGGQNQNQNEDETCQIKMTTTATTVTGKQEQQLPPASSSSSSSSQLPRIALYSPSMKSLRGVFSPWDLQQQNIHLVSLPPEPRGRLIHVRAKFHVPEEKRQFHEQAIDDILPLDLYGNDDDGGGALECRFSSREELRKSLLGRE